MFLILLSKLFIVDYDRKSQCLGVVKFNSISKISNKLIPLGGIKTHNLNNLKNIPCEGFVFIRSKKSRLILLTGFLIKLKFYQLE